MFLCPSCSKSEIREGEPCPSCGHVIQSFRTWETIQQSFTQLGGVPAPAAVGSALKPGEIFSERYRIEELLGRGGMGSVYRVHDIKENVDRALKLLHPDFAEDDGADRFRREIEILSKIHHPAVLRIYEWGSRGKQLFFVAELIQGWDLKTELLRRGPWSPMPAAGLIAQVADALAAAHSQGIVHRDIKPQNIMITEDRSVRLLDFGVALARGGGMQTLTKTGMIIGTPEYMSPEQFGSHRVDFSSDLYSLGVVLFELLTGQLPFNGHPMEIALKIVTEKALPPRMLRNDVPGWLDRIVVRCLQKNPGDRYASAGDLAADLKRLRGNEKPKMRWLPGGDGILEDPSDSNDWALILSTSREREAWKPGMALRFEDLLYRLERITAPDESSRRWFYFFSYWPSQEVYRQMIDYATDRMEKG